MGNDRKSSDRNSIPDSAFGSPLVDDPNRVDPETQPSFGWLLANSPLEDTDWPICKPARQVDI
ncbi:hypothetical protein AB4Z52_22945 [Rhizobium sp. 2YAF20]|uniref:hypothetical protein n=1 Tax=Rhizobium sp. 2YAF20 TaxID=3233027 RepID=UPI003F973239